MLQLSDNFQKDLENKQTSGNYMSDLRNSLGLQ